MMAGKDTDFSPRQTIEYKTRLPLLLAITQTFRSRGPVWPISPWRVSFSLALAPSIPNLGFRECRPGQEFAGAGDRVLGHGRRLWDASGPQVGD